MADLGALGGEENLLGGEEETAGGKETYEAMAFLTKAAYLNDKPTSMRVPSVFNGSRATSRRRMSPSAESVRSEPHNRAPAT
jgi:hypothetical protein